MDIYYTSIAIHIADTMTNTDHCEQWRMRPPVWHIISDRRGKPSIQLHDRGKKERKKEIGQERGTRKVGKKERLTPNTPGGRTAWSSTVCIEGQLQHVPARYWYDGQYINNAKEDAAEVALQRLHVIASPTSPAHAHLCTAAHGNIYKPN